MPARFFIQPFVKFFSVLLLLGFAAQSGAQAAPAKFKVSQFEFERPAKWESVEVTSQMRKAQLKVPGSKPSESAEVIFFYFGPGNGGGTQANVDRWYGQFQEPRAQIKAKSEAVKVGNVPVTYVYAEGTYSSGMPGGPKTPLPNHALIGAIIEGSEGSVFIRMVGPIELAKASNAEFRKMVESAIPK